MERYGQHFLSAIALCFHAADWTNVLPQGILNEVWKYKLIFVETPDANETSIALENYRRVRKILTWRVALSRLILQLAAGV